MKIQSILYEFIGLSFLLGSSAGMFQAVVFMSQRDYISAILMLAAMSVVIHAGVELCKLAVLTRREVHS